VEKDLNDLISKVETGADDMESKANALYQDGKYSECYDMLKQFIQPKSKAAKLCLLAAQCSEQLQKWNEAEDFYEYAYFS
jgi:hypothetical protein